MSELSVNHLLGIKYITLEDIDLIFKTADHFKEVINRPIKKVPSLRDITIANLFFENSTRTKLSFELAEKRLSADVINFSAAASSVKKGETLIDTVNNILSMKVDMVVMRHPNPGAGVFLSKHINASIINAGDGAHEHPTQALLDSYSIREKLGEVAGKNVVRVFVCTCTSSVQRDDVGLCRTPWQAKVLLATVSYPQHIARERLHEHVGRKKALK